MANADTAVKIVVALTVGGLMAAFLLPIAIGAIAGPEAATHNQTVDETVELQPGLNATVTGVTADTSATYTIEAGNDSVTGETVNEGENSTVTVDGEDVTIHNEEAGSDYAVTTYDYPTTYGWGNGAGALWGILPVIIVLAVFLYFVWVALRRL